MYAFFIKIKKIRAFLALIDKFSGSIILQIFLLYHQNTLLPETFAGRNLYGFAAKISDNKVSPFSMII